MATPHGLTPDQNRLAAELYHDVATNVIRRAVRRWPEREDTIVSAAGWATCQAVKRWDERKGITLKQYVGYRVKQMIRRELYRHGSLPKSVRCDLAEFPAPVETEPGPVWEALVGRLSPRQREVLERVYVDGMGPSHAAEVMGTTRGNIFLYEKTALDHIRRDLEHEDVAL